MAGKSTDGKVRCSFCNKTQDQVRKLIAGPAGVYICDECVDICSDIIEEDVYDAISLKTCVGGRTAIGGPATSTVEDYLNNL